MVCRLEWSLWFAFFNGIISFEAIKGYEPTICIGEDDRLRVLTQIFGFGEVVWRARRELNPGPPGFFAVLEL